MENQKVLENINLVKQEVITACANSINAKLKRIDNVKIIAVTKRQPLERIIAALNAGHKVYGENQVQESLRKWPNLKKKYKNIELHLVGPFKVIKLKKQFKFLMLSKP